MNAATQRVLFRLVTAGFAIGIALCGWVVGFAQGGPDWDVPQIVVRALTFAPGTALLLGLIGVGTALTARFYPAVPSGASRAHFAIAVIVLLLPLLVWVLEPAQWVVQSPQLSSIAALLPIPSFVVAAALFWLIAVWALRNPSP